MPTISLTITGEIPASVSLIALTRDDSGTTPAGVTLPASFTLASGAWVYSFTDNVLPPTGYGYEYQLNWTDGSSDQQNGSIPVGSTAAGRYYSQAGIERIYGIANVAKWSNKEGDSTTADATAIAAEGSATDDEIDSRARRAGYAVPIASTSADFSRIQYIANEIAGVRLYMGRGEIQNADTQSIAGQMEAHRRRAYDELDELLFGMVPGVGLDAPRAAGWNNAPVAVAASVDPSGVPVGVAPFGRWTWDGYQYRWTT